jgi:hypothetical protein
MPKKAGIDVARLINDCGGVQMVSVMAGINRTAVYSILRRKRMNTDQLAAIIKVFKRVDIRNYMEVATDESVG